jgi:hypothetical protein
MAQPECMSRGCTWQNGGMYCNGAPAPCEDYLAQTQCVQGCTWSDSGLTCTGTVTPCSQLMTQRECTSQPGCSWM